MPHFLECEQSHFFERFGSFVMAKMSNKREEFVQRGGRSSLGAQCSVFSVMRSFREHFDVPFEVDYSQLYLASFVC